MRFDGEGHVGNAGSSVRAYIYFVGVDAVRPQPEIGNVVCSQPVSHARVGSGPQVSADVKDAVGFPGNDGAILCNAGFEIVGDRPAGCVESEDLLAGIVGRAGQQQTGNGEVSESRAVSEAAIMRRTRAGRV